MDAAPAAKPRPNMLVAISVAAFAVVYPFAVDLFDGEAAQVVIGAVLGLAYGYAIGHVVPGRRKPFYFALACLVGLAAWVAALVYVSIRYSGAPLLGIWFFRFGVATALLFAAGALAGDAVQRQKFSLSSGTLAAAIALAGLIVSILQLVS
jgi:hydrogenase/urease accessory protein HupE